MEDRPPPPAPPPKVPVDALIGTVLDGTYRIRRRLGSGGMAVVYEAVELSIDRPVAIKVLNENYRGVDEHRVRFRNEAKLAARIEHNNLVRIYRCEIDSDSIPYIVMELLDGHDLQAEVKQGLRMDWRRAAKLVIQLCDALDAAHRLGIIHRDVKPANCFLCASSEEEGDRLKLLDLGIAKISGELASRETTIPQTVRGHVFGTWTYMAPEQLSQKPVIQTDIYAVGALLYRLITGRHALERSGLSDSQFAMKIFHEQPRPPSDYAKDLPTELEELIMTALAKTPTERPQSANAVRDALTQCLTADLDERRGRRRPPPLRALFYTITGMGAATCVAATMLLLSLSGNAEGERVEVEVPAPSVDAEAQPDEADDVYSGSSEGGLPGPESSTSPTSSTSAVVDAGSTTTSASTDTTTTTGQDEPETVADTDTATTEPAERPAGSDDRRNSIRALRRLTPSLAPCHSDPFGRALKVEVSLQLTIDGDHATLAKATVTHLAYDKKPLPVSTHRTIAECVQSRLIGQSVDDIEVGGRFSRLRMTIK